MNSCLPFYCSAGFGAIRDGLTRDTAAIQAAVDDLPLISRAGLMARNTRGLRLLNARIHGQTRDALISIQLSKPKYPLDKEK